MRAIFLFISLVATFSCLFSQETEHLKLSDVQRVMKEIFEKHVETKAITTKVIQNALKIYIEQFDPSHIYLLESEVAPYLALSEEELQQIEEQYQKNIFTTYSQLNKILQNAILRARIIRSDLMSDPQRLFRESQDIRSAQPPPYSNFAVTPEELRERIRQAILQFLREESKKFGEAEVAKRQTKLLSVYEGRMENEENQYLFVQADGSPLPTQGQENLFALHLLKSLARSLDIHTTYYNPTEATEMRVRLEKGYNGVGITVKDTVDGYVVDKMTAKSPAEKSQAIRMGDRLVKIDGKNTANYTTSEIQDFLEGNKGEQVVLTLERDNAPSFDIRLTMAPIEVDEERVKVQEEVFSGGRIGIIKLDSFYISDFGFSSEEDVKAAIEKLKAKGDLRGLILDLRANSGGFLTQAVKVVGLFISNGIVVISKYSSGEERIFRDVDSHIEYRGPLVILTSRLTASAAEIVAQTLQDYGVALIVGDEKTYGKGTIQSQTVTDEGKGSYFKVTVGKYYTPSGETPQLLGVRADLVVPSIVSHEEIGEEYLDHPLAHDTIPSSFQDPLSDIDPKLKSWYLKYYTPNLQKPLSYWRSMIPALRKNSEYRIRRNPSYAREVEEGPRVDEKQPDYQLREAINIVKDMLYLQSQAKE